MAERQAEAQKFQHLEPKSTRSAGKKKTRLTLKRKSLRSSNQASSCIPTFDALTTIRTGQISPPHEKREFFRGRIRITAMIVELFSGRRPRFEAGAASA